MALTDGDHWIRFPLWQYMAHSGEEHGYHIDLDPGSGTLDCRFHGALDALTIAGPPIQAARPFDITLELTGVPFLHAIAAVGVEDFYVRSTLGVLLPFNYLWLQLTAATGGANDADYLIRWVGAWRK